MDIPIIDKTKNLIKISIIGIVDDKFAILMIFFDIFFYGISSNKNVLGGLGS